MTDIDLDRMAKWLLLKTDECACGHHRNYHLKLKDDITVCDGCSPPVCIYEPTGEEFVNLLTQLVAGNEEETRFALEVLSQVVEHYRNHPRS